MTGRSVSLVLLASLVAFPGLADAQDRQTDDISRQLFETYLAGAVKVESSTIRAAEDLVAARGRKTGFWKYVLAELKRNDEGNEINCVRVLGKMLAIDASARDTIRIRREKVREYKETLKQAGQNERQRPAALAGALGFATVVSVRLEPEIVAELITRGKQADRIRIDHYVIALARARVPEARDFFELILRVEKVDDPFGGRAAPDGPNHLPTTRFHAAVGLAQLGDPLGIDWLVANCENPNGTVSSAWPRGASANDSLDRCCTLALQQLSGRRDVTSKADWEAWSKTVDKSVLTSHAVDLIEQSCW